MTSTEVEDSGSISVLHPELLSKDELYNVLSQRFVKLENRLATKEDLLCLFHRTVTPLPQRKPRANRRGRLTAQIHLQMGTKRRRDEEKESRATFKLGFSKSEKIDNSPVMQLNRTKDRLKPPPALSRVKPPPATALLKPPGVVINKQRANKWKPSEISTEAANISIKTPKISTETAKISTETTVMPKISPEQNLIDQTTKSKRPKIVYDRTTDGGSPQGPRSRDPSTGTERKQIIVTNQPSPSSVTSRRNLSTVKIKRKSKSANSPVKPAAEVVCKPEVIKPEASLRRDSVDMNKKNNITITSSSSTKDSSSSEEPSPKKMKKIIWP